jgi:hypothetical protein
VAALEPKGIQSITEATEPGRQNARNAKAQIMISHIVRTIKRWLTSLPNF